MAKQRNELNTNRKEKESRRRRFQSSNFPTFSIRFPGRIEKKKKRKKKNRVRLMKRLPTVALESSNECSNYQR